MLILFYLFIVLHFCLVREATKIAYPAHTEQESGATTLSVMYFAQEGGEGGTIDHYLL